MLRRLAPCGSGHRDHTSVATPERRAALISWGLPRQQGSLLTKVNERTGEWGMLRRPRDGRAQAHRRTSGPIGAPPPPRCDSEKRSGASILYTPHGALGHLVPPRAA